MYPFSLVSMKNFVTGVLDSAATTWATKQVAVSVCTSVIGTVFDEADRLILRMSACLVICANRDQSRLNLWIQQAIDRSDCDVGAMEV